jgi:hypothetical protein
MVHLINGHKYITLFYDQNINRLVDGFGNVINNIYRIITPNQFMLFRKNMDMRTVMDITNEFKVTLIYLEESKDLNY